MEFVSSVETICINVKTYFMWKKDIISLFSAKNLIQGAKR